ncbi:hypothetical protein F2Q70_00036179 [Brassica cretica]|uniref:Uncharacterized protein n=1 Tax=Brassica cretica TaxID=69181 RepID=A0A8S9JYU3_BRACR|nr:hypothetical protein F2Q70_00036179 [Brassica cretica]
MSHLSLSKNVNTGPEVQKDTISTSLLRSKVIHDLSPRDKEIINPNKEEPSSQEVKRSLSAFHKAQDHEKWSRNYEVMIQSPKPAKPVLHLSQLEPNRFNQRQTRHWRPGDHFNQSGGIPEVLRFTITYRIRWILEEVIKLIRNYLCKDWTIFRFNPFQPNQLRPEDNKTKSRI